MPQDMRPIPETDFVNGQLEDIGYNEADVNKYNDESVQYEKRVMDSIETAGPDPIQAPYEEALHNTDPSFWDMMTDSEFWRRDVAPRVGNAAKGIAANAAGAPMDLTTLGAHTLRYVYENRYTMGNYGFLEDMPDFENIPLTGDWIGKNVFNANVDTPEFAVSGFLSPDPKDLAVAAKLAAKVAGANVKEAMILGPIGFAEATKIAGEVDPDLNRSLRGGHQEYRQMLKDGVPEEEAYHATGFWEGPDGITRWWLPDEDAVFTKPEDLSRFFDEANLVKEDGVDKALIPLEEIMQHDSLFAVYPELRGINLRLNMKEVPMGSDVTGRTSGASFPSFQNTTKTNQYIVHNSAKPYIASVNHGDPRASKTYFDVAKWKGDLDFEGTVLHEVQHVIQGIEGMGRGGSTREFEGMTRRLAEAKADMLFSKMLEDVEAGLYSVFDTEEIALRLDTDYKELVDSMDLMGFTPEISQIQNTLKRLEDPIEAAVLDSRVRKQADDFRAWIQAAERMEMSVEDTVKWMKENSAVTWTPYDIYASLSGEVDSRFTQEIYTRLGEDALRWNSPMSVQEGLLVKPVPKGVQIVEPQNVGGVRGATLARESVEAPNINIKQIQKFEDELQSISDQIDVLEATKADMANFGPTDNLAGAQLTDRIIQGDLDDKISTLETQFEKIEDARNALGPE